MYESLWPFRSRLWHKVMLLPLVEAELFSDSGKLDCWVLSIPSFNYQMTPKISLNTRCSISISENLLINGQTRSSDQLGIWSYNINP